jgi:hypothetical protein
MLLPATVPLTHVYLAPEAFGQNLTARPDVGPQVAVVMVIVPPQQGLPTTADTHVNVSPSFRPVAHPPGLHAGRLTLLVVVTADPPGQVQATTCSSFVIGVHPADAEEVNSTCGATQAPTAAAPSPARCRNARRS